MQKSVHLSMVPFSAAITDEQLSQETQQAYLLEKTPQSLLTAGSNSVIATHKGFKMNSYLVETEDAC